MDFRRTRNKSNSISHTGEDLTMMEDYKYLDVHLDNTLAYKKGQSRLYFLRNLRYYSVCRKMLHIFYKSVVESSVSSAVICWKSSIRASDLKKLKKLIKKAGSVLGTVMEPLELIVQKKDTS